MIDDTESTNLPELRPLSFGEIFSHGWSLLPRTLPNAGLLGLLFFVPLAWLIGTQVQNFMIGFAEVAPHLNAASGNAPPPGMIEWLMSLAMVFVLGLIGIILLSYVQNAMVIAAWEGYNGRTIGFGDMMREAWGRRFWHSVVQYFMFMAITLMVSIVLGVVGVGLQLAMGKVGGNISSLISNVAVQYFTIITLLRTQQVMLERRGPWRGLIASISLIKGNFWKAAGLYILFIIPIAIVGVVVLFPAIQDFIAATASQSGLMDAANGTGGGTPDTVAIAKLYTIIAEALQSWMFPVLGALSVIGLLVMNNGMTALYVDLRTRRGDFNEIIDEDDIL